jgi:TldD protein
MTLEDLIGDTKRGIYVEDIESGSADQQVLNGQFSIRDGVAREIRSGKLGDRLRDVAIQFVTPEFWRSMDATGGAGSAVDTIQSAGFSLIAVIQLPFATVTAPPARVRKVNVLNIGQTS